MRQGTLVERLTLSVFSVLGCLAAQSAVWAESEAIPIDSDRWVVTAGGMSERGGRQCLAGTAHLEDVRFTDGVVEVDVWMADDLRSYPGIQFRRRSAGETEVVYLRPHRSPLYDDAVQYTPVINGVSAWQLYNGTGFSSSAKIPREEWLRLRLEVVGTQARLFLADAQEPALAVDHLKCELGAGTIGLTDAVVGNSCFSNFSYRLDSKTKIGPPLPTDIPPGLITDWRLSTVLDPGDMDGRNLPSEEQMSALDWVQAEVEPSGLVNIARHVGRTGRGPDTVLARTTIQADSDSVRKFLFGYSDRLVLFVNGKPLYSGESGYRTRDTSFLGIVGLNDAVYLPLEKGENELVMMITEVFGGWGFICQDGEATFRHRELTEVWETAPTFTIPESVAYDPRREAIYVSNYDGYNPSRDEGKQHLTRLLPDGSVDELRWITGLRNPTGLVVSGDRLFVVERTGIVEVDLSTEEITARYPAPRSAFLNDVAVDKNGTVYVSDSRRNVILRLADGVFEEWLTGNGIANPNGVYVLGNRLLVGNNGDGCIKAVDVDTKDVRTVACLAQGIIDGVSSDGKGNYLVSHNEGRLYRISRSGEITKLLDTTVTQRFAADFEYVAETGLVLIPTFIDNRVVAYRLAQ